MEANFESQGKENWFFMHTGIFGFNSLRIINCCKKLIRQHRLIDFSLCGKLILYMLLLFFFNIGLLSEGMGHSSPLTAAIITLQFTSLLMTLPQLTTQRFSFPYKNVFSKISQSKIHGWQRFLQKRSSFSLLAFCSKRGNSNQKPD